MSVPIPPELNPDIPQQPPITPDQSQNEPIPPTNSGALDSMFAQTARETLQENARLRAELDTARRTSIQQPSATSQQYWDNPVEVNRNLVREEITAALAPFTQDITAMRRGQAYQSLKAQAKGLINNFNLVENMVDIAMANMEPNVQNFQAAVSYAFGQLYLNGGLSQSITPTTPPVNNQRPPYIPPSAPPAPNNTPTAANIPLTESELLVMRQAGFKTEEEFKKWRDLDFTKLKPE